MLAKLSSTIVLRHISLISLILSIVTLLTGYFIFPHRQSSPSLAVIIVFSFFAISASSLTIDFIIKVHRREKIRILSIVGGIIVGFISIMLIIILINEIVKYLFI
jgi:hypothetical protein